MFFAICAFVLWIFFAPIIPGIPFTLAGIGGVMMFFAYSHEPKLLFILPFTAIRLTVIDTSVGYPIFTHTWNHKGRLADETLFSGMLHGVSMIIQESLQSGEVQEIRVTDAIILTHPIPGYHFACVLVVTRPTQSLRDGLRLFAERFLLQFHDFFENSFISSQFDGAEE